jgi:large subunit ribosomal protein L17
MRHRRRVKHFSRKSSARKALLRGLVESLVEHGRISTTVEKAKEVRRHVEKAITVGKKGTLAAHRLVLSRYPSAKTAQIIMKDLAPRFKTRSGGYTRIIKIGRRPGDTAEMAFLEFVDYDFKVAKTSEAEEAQAPSAEAKKTTKKKKPVKVALKKVKKSTVAVKKTVKKIQKKARKAARA